MGAPLSGVAWANSAGVRIAYQILGRHGPWLVLVHGLGYGRSGWGPFARLIAEERRVVLVDNRGIGESGAPPGPYSVPLMADDIVAVLDDLGLERADVAGASLGGMVALQLAAAHPERVQRLVLIAATPGPPQGTPLPGTTKALLAGHVKANTKTVRRLVEGALSPVTVAERPELVERLLAYRREEPQSLDAWRAQAAASATWSLGVSLGDLSTPTLAVAGLDDRVIDPANTMRLALGLGRGRGVFLAPAGHLCFWEHPGLVAGAVTDFLGAKVPAEAEK